MPSSLIFVHIRPFRGADVKLDWEDPDPPLKMDAFRPGMFESERNPRDQLLSMLSQVERNVVENAWRLRKPMPALADVMEMAGDRLRSLIQLLVQGDDGKPISTEKLSAELMYCLHLLEAVACSTEHILQDDRLKSRMWNIAGPLGIAVAVAVHRGLIPSPYDGFVSGDEGLALPPLGPDRRTKGRSAKKRVRKAAAAKPAIDRVLAAESPTNNEQPPTRTRLSPSRRRSTKSA
jgi:hypothetical protein